MSFVKIRTQAFVLKKRLLLGSDMQVTLFSKEYGKIVTIVKGGRAINSRRAPHLQTGNLIDIICSVSHEVYYLQSSSLVSLFSKIKESEILLGYVYTYLFIVEGLTPIGANEVYIFNNLLKFFIDLNSSTSPDTVFKNKLIELLVYLGYVDELNIPLNLITFTEELLGKRVPRYAIITE